MDQSGGEMRINQHPVLQAIALRRKNGSAPGRRQDNFRIALAIEGGAMRGVVSSGMLAGLEYLGVLPAFDVIYGTSAGAINGAYFVAGQAAWGAARNEHAGMCQARSSLGSSAYLFDNLPQQPAARSDTSQRDLVREGGLGDV
jgi:hypothetical protein